MAAKTTTDKTANVIPPMKTQSVSRRAIVLPLEVFFCGRTARTFVLFARHKVGDYRLPDCLLELDLDHLGRAARPGAQTCASHDSVRALARCGPARSGAPITRWRMSCTKSSVFSVERLPVRLSLEFADETAADSGKGL